MENDPLARNENVHHFRLALGGICNGSTPRLKKLRTLFEDPDLLEFVSGHFSPLPDFCVQNMQLFGEHEVNRLDIRNGLRVILDLESHIRLEIAINWVHVIVV
jgi:hypothetical protein